MDLREDTCSDPLHHAQMASRAGAEVARQCFPLAAGTHAVEDARHGDAIRNTRSAALRLGLLTRQQGLDPLPEAVGEIEEVLVHGPVETITERRLKGQEYT